MNIKKVRILLILFIVIVSLLYGCSMNGNETVKYKYLNGIAGFTQSYKDGYVYFTNTDYTEEDSYTESAPMIRWVDEKGQGTIVSAAQVIANDGKELYKKPLEIIYAGDDSDTWDYKVEYSYSVKAKCEPDATSECYIKMIDSNNIEYHVMLTPVEKFNYGGYVGSAVYIIDKDNNKEFWYDDLLAELYDDSNS